MMFSKFIFLCLIIVNFVNCDDIKDFPGSTDLSDFHNDTVINLLSIFMRNKELFFFFKWLVTVDRKGWGKLINAVENKI